ncbi:MAG: lipocalin family protein [Pseudomonadota bacterium]
MKHRAYLSKLCAVALLAGLTACGSTYRDQAVTMTAKQDFDASRYLGTWYEIARYPVPFQTGCVATTAEYGPVDADTVSVLNSCRQDTPQGRRKQIAGSADVVGPGKLKVSFDNVPFVRGNYWVLWTDEDYTTAVVGVPSGKAGWILARTPSISAESRAEAERVLRANGYDLKGVIEVPHS